MAWTAPRTYVAGELMSALILNAQIRDNMLALRDTYGTSFPASPATGDKHVLVDSVTAPTYQWTFRYNASSTYADKWEFVGGADGERFAAGTINSGAGNSVWSAALGPSFTIPRGGVYDVEVGGKDNGNAAGSTTYFGFGISAVPVVPNYYAAGNSSIYFAVPRRVTLAAANVLDFYILDSDTTRRNAWADRKMTVTPVRLS